MFDTMTLTKAVGAICGSLLIFLFATWAAESLYSTEPSAGHEGEEAAQAYAIDTGAATGEEASAEEGPPFAELLAAADVAAGEKTFGKCKACHKLDGTNGTGPHLDGVVNRARGTVEGFGYSDAMKSASDPWLPEAISAFLESPKVYIPGTKMTFAGLPKAQDRANVIAYLATLP